MWAEEIAELLPHLTEAERKEVMDRMTPCGNLCNMRSH